jgi:DNA adenine methylase
LQLDKVKLEQEINKFHPITNTIFKNCKVILQDITCDKFIRAAAYFAINRSSFSGSTTSGGFSEESGNTRFTKSSIIKMKKTNLSNITFTNLDFSDFLTNIPKEKFIFLDPPYYLGTKSKLYGNKGDLHEDFDHDKLYSCINKKNNFILCYNDCDYIRNLYKNFTIISVSWTYGMNATKKSSEILIMPITYTKKINTNK